MLHLLLLVWLSNIWIHRRRRLENPFKAAQSFIFSSLFNSFYLKVKNLLQDLIFTLVVILTFLVDISLDGSKMTCCSFLPEKEEVCGVWIKCATKKCSFNSDDLAPLSLQSFQLLKCLWILKLWLETTLKLFYIITVATICSHWITSSIHFISRTLNRQTQCVTDEMQPAGRNCVLTSRPLSCTWGGVDGSWEQPQQQEVMSQTRSAPNSNN